MQQLWNSLAGIPSLSLALLIVIFHNTTLLVVVTQLCPNLCDPIVCSLTSYSVHGILQARIMEWVAIPFPGDPPSPGIETGSPTL